MNPKIWLSSPHMGGTEQKYVNEAFDTNWVAPLGPNVNAFEKALVDYTQTGYASALSAGTAAIHLALILLGVGRGQMEVLDERVAQRRANFAYYKQHLGGMDGVSFSEEPDKDFFSNHWLTCILLDPEKTGGVTREDLRLMMEGENIDCRPLWKPMHLQPVFKDVPFYGNGTSERLFDEGLCLPSGSNLSTDDLDSVIEVVKKTLHNH